MLLQLGFYYCELEAFVKAERFSAGRKVKSQYRCALANGVQGEACDEEAAKMCAAWKTLLFQLCEAKNISPKKPFFCDSEVLQSI